MRLNQIPLGHPRLNPRQMGRGKIVCLLRRNLGERRLGCAQVRMKLASGLLCDVVSSAMTAWASVAPAVAAAGMSPVGGAVGRAEADPPIKLLPELVNQMAPSGSDVISDQVLACVARTRVEAEVSRAWV